MHTACHIRCLPNPAQQVTLAANRKRAKCAAKCCHRQAATTFIWNYIREQSLFSARWVRVPVELQTNSLVLCHNILTGSFTFNRSRFAKLPFAGNHIWRCICAHIPVKDHFNVICAWNVSARNHHSILTSASIQVSIKIQPSTITNHTHKVPDHSHLSPFLSNVFHFFLHI